MAKPTLYFVPKTLYLCCTWIKSYLVKGLWIIINYSIYSIHDFNPFLYQSSVICNSEDDHLFWSCLWLGVILLGDVGPLTPRPNVSVAHDMAMLEVGKKISHCMFCVLASSSSKMFATFFTKHLDNGCHVLVSWLQCPKVIFQGEPCKFLPRIFLLHVGTSPKPL